MTEKEFNAEIDRLVVDRDKWRTRCMNADGEIARLAEENKKLTRQLAARNLIVEELKAQIKSLEINLDVISQLRNVGI